MEETRLREIIGTELGNKTEVFVSFFMARFPNENGHITSYVGEWVDRFKTDNPLMFMDNKSKQIYEGVVKIIYKR